MTEHIILLTDQDKKPKPFTVDGHVDLPYYIRSLGCLDSIHSLEQGPFTLKTAKNAGIRIFCTALYCEDRFNGNGSFTHFQDVLNHTLKIYDEFPIIKEQGQLDRLTEARDMIGTVLLLENADMLARNPDRVELLLKTGIRMAGLTHAGKNRLADGNEVRYSDGLSDEGRKVVQALDENGLIIDIAHLHETCFWQLLDLTEAPIITSHTGIKSICNTPRNVDMEQAGKICERNGMIGISFNPEMLSEDSSSNVHVVFAHLDSLVQKFGPDHVGIGSDFCGYDGQTDGLEDPTGLDMLVRIMLKHGYGDDAVARIMGLNWLEFYRSLFSESYA